jgi:hypothetical protein
MDSFFEVKINDYLIDQKGVNWPEVLRPFHWVLPESFTLWLVNRFGDLFTVLEDGSVHHLDIGTAMLARLADSRDDFAKKLDVDNNANDWLMIPLVDRLVASGKVLAPGQCYSYVQLPVLGGDYSVENTVVRDIPAHFAALGPIHEGIRDLPDGTKVRFNTED